MLKVEKDGKIDGKKVGQNSVERMSVEWDEVGREAFGLMLGWEQIVEGLEILMSVQQLHLGELSHILVAYVRRR